jgi:hypothetical protein
VYTGRSLPHTWYPECQLFGILNAHALLQLESKVRGLALRKHWHLERQSSHTEWFLLAYTIGPMSADQHKQIGIRGGARFFQLRGASIKQNEKFKNQ